MDSMVDELVVLLLCQYECINRLELCIKYERRLELEATLERCRTTMAQHYRRIDTFFRFNNSNSADEDISDYKKLLVKFSLHLLNRFFIPFCAQDGLSHQCRLHLQTGCRFCTLYFCSPVVDGTEFGYSSLRLGLPHLLMLLKTASSIQNLSFDGQIVTLLHGYIFRLIQEEPRGKRERLLNELTRDLTAYDEIRNQFDPPEWNVFHEGLGVIYNDFMDGSADTSDQIRQAWRMNIERGLLHLICALMCMVSDKDGKSLDEMAGGLGLTVTNIEDWQDELAEDDDRLPADMLRAMARRCSRVIEHDCSTADRLPSHLKLEMRFMAHGRTILAKSFANDPPSGLADDARDAMDDEQLEPVTVVNPQDVVVVQQVEERAQSDAETAPPPPQRLRPASPAPLQPHEQRRSRPATDRVPSPTVFLSSEPEQQRPRSKAAHQVDSTRPPSAAPSRDSLGGSHMGGRRAKNVWTEAEVAALEAGLQKFGRSWASILAKYKKVFHPTRTNVDLKDKARNERMRRQRNGLGLGGFACC